MTAHPDNFDPAALLAEWTRVHEAATPGEWREDSGSFDTTIESQYVTVAAYCDATDAIAIAHYHNTYAALLDVVRGLLEERRIALAVLGYAKASEQLRADMQLIAGLTGRLLAPLFESPEIPNHD